MYYYKRFVALHVVLVKLDLGTYLGTYLRNTSVLLLEENGAAGCDIQHEG
jgi:hypothetical protein